MFETHIISLSIGGNGMIAEIIKYVTIYLLTMIKFIAGPTLGQAAGLSWGATVFITVAGMMTSVLLFSSHKLKKLALSRFKKRKKFTKSSRRFVMIWKKYGLFGVSFLTPIIFTPIGGTILASFVGGKRKTIIYYMLFSAVFWSIVFTTIFYYFITEFKFW